MTPRRLPVADFRNRSDAALWLTHVRTVSRSDEIITAIAPVMPRASESAAIATAFRDTLPEKNAHARRPGAPKNRRAGARTPRSTAENRRRRKDRERGDGAGHGPESERAEIRRPEGGTRLRGPRGAARKPRAANLGARRRRPDSTEPGRIVVAGATLAASAAGAREAASDARSPDGGGRQEGLGGARERERRCRLVDVDDGSPDGGNRGSRKREAERLARRRFPRRRSRALRPRKPEKSLAVEAPSARRVPISGRRRSTEIESVL